MIDNFAIVLTHGLMLLAAWRLLSRPDLDKEESPLDTATGVTDKQSGQKGRTRA